MRQKHCFPRVECLPRIRITRARLLGASQVYQALPPPLLLLLTLFRESRPRLVQSPAYFGVVVGNIFGLNVLSIHL
jgi:hypothetical protein